MSSIAYVPLDITVFIYLRFTSALTFVNQKTEQLDIQYTPDNSNLQGIKKCSSYRDIQ